MTEKKILVVVTHGGYTSILEFPADAAIEVNGVITQPMDSETIGSVPKKGKTPRSPRGARVFYFHDGVMREHFPKSKTNKETCVSKFEYDRITTFFLGKLDPIGRLRVKANKSKEVGINQNKINAVTHFLKKMNVLKSAERQRIYYAEKVHFSEQALQAWRKLEEREVIE